MNKKKSVNNVNCCVYGCHSKKGREKHLSFHRFPTEHSSYVKIRNKFGFQDQICRRKAWEEILLMAKPSTRSLRVCSLHFRRDDFILPDFVAKLARLKRNAVPSQNLPQKCLLRISSKVSAEQKHNNNTNTTGVEFSEASRKCGSLKVEIKTEQIEFDLEDLHHSIDIKEEAFYP